MTDFRQRPLPAVLALTALAAAAVTACSSPSQPGPAATPAGSDTAALRSADAPALIVDCALRRGLLKPPAGLVTPSHGQPWLQGRSVVITTANAPYFSEWYTGNDATVVAGRQLAEWTMDTASSGKLPAAVCGPGASARQLQKQVFAHNPSAGNPWPR